MREEDKPFVCYRQGWSMKIVPRNAAGWRALGLWLLSLLALVGPLLAVLSTDPGRSAETIAVGVFLAATALWTVAMIRWMLARSEVVDLAELMRLKRDRDRATDRSRGRKS